MDDFENFMKNTPELGPFDVIGESSVRKRLKNAFITLWQVIEYEKYIKQLEKDALSLKNRNKQIEACCKIIAHTYLLRIMHFTSGTRIGNMFTVHPAIQHL